MDVYEQESDLFFEDLSNEVVKDDVFQRLLTFPDVIVTGHQAFFTREALAAIAQITLQNIADLEAGRPDLARLVKAASSPSVRQAAMGTSRGRFRQRSR
jgi:D-lactate dehydrogenase